jgi:hypothetical protein
MLGVSLPWRPAILRHARSIAAEESLQSMHLMRSIDAID